MSYLWVQRLTEGSGPAQLPQLPQLSSGQLQLSLGLQAEQLPRGKVRLLKIKCQEKKLEPKVQVAKIYSIFFNNGKKCGFGTLSMCKVLFSVEN